MTQNNENPSPSGFHRELKVLRATVIVLAVSLVAVVIWVARLATGPGPVLTAERLNIVEPDGELAMVLSNSENVPRPSIDGQVLESASPRNMPAIIFFDGQGDEVGGLLLQNKEHEEGYQAVRHLSFDQFGQDQTLVLHHDEKNGRANTGLRIIDRPFGVSLLDAMEAAGLDPSANREEAMAAFRALDEEQRRKYFHAAMRVQLGSDLDGTARLSLGDGNGRTRIRMAVTEEGDARLEFLDEEGEVIQRLPEAD